MKKNFAERARAIEATYGRGSGTTNKLLKQLYAEQQKFAKGGDLNMENEIKRGIQVELEHAGSLKEIEEKGKMPTAEQFARLIATDHIKDFKKEHDSGSYYKSLIEGDLSDEAKKYALGGSIAPTKVSNAQLESLRQYMTGGHLMSAGTPMDSTNRYATEELYADGGTIKTNMIRPVDIAGRAPTRSEVEERHGSAGLSGRKEDIEAWIRYKQSQKAPAGGNPVTPRQATPERSFGFGGNLGELSPLTAPQFAFGGTIPVNTGGIYGAGINVYAEGDTLNTKKPSYADNFNPFSRQFWTPQEGTTDMFGVKVGDPEPAWQTGAKMIPAVAGVMTGVAPIAAGAGLLGATANYLTKPSAKRDKWDVVRAGVEGAGAVVPAVGVVGSAASGLLPKFLTKMIQPSMLKAAGSMTSASRLGPSAAYLSDIAGDNSSTSNEALVNNTIGATGITKNAFTQTPNSKYSTEENPNLWDGRTNVIKKTTTSGATKKPAIAPPPGIESLRYTPRDAQMSESQIAGLSLPEMQMPQDNIQISENVDMTGVGAPKNFDWQNTMRMAPIAFNALSGLLTKKGRGLPTNVNLQGIVPQVIAPEQISTAPIEQQIGQQYASGVNALSGAGNSAAAIRAGLPGMSLAGAQGGGAALNDIYARNAGLRGEATKFNALSAGDAAKFNAQQSNLSKQINLSNLEKNQADKAATDKERYNRFAAAATGIGQVGKENWSKDMLSNLYGYNEKGEHVSGDPKMNLSKKQLATINKLGGYLKFK